MERNQRMVGSTLLLAALFASLFFAGTARAQSQAPAYVGKFTLTQQIHWGKSNLRPGDYTLKIISTSSPVFAQISTAEGITVGYFMTGDRSKKTNGVNGLLIKEKDGQPTVYSLALADLGMVLIYDPSLAHEEPQEARVSQTIPVMWAKGRSVTQRGEAGTRAGRTTLRPDGPRLHGLLIEILQQGHRLLF